jgi:hypothetical protein
LNQSAEPRLWRQSADLLRQQFVHDGWAWAVVTVWDAPAARVCCDSQERGIPVAEVVRLSSGTVILQAAVDAFLDHQDLARSTRRVYRASLSSLIAELGPATAVGELSGPRLAGWFHDRRRPAYLPVSRLSGPTRE